MTWGKPATHQPRDRFSALITVLTVITTLGIAARLLAPVHDTLAQAPAVEPLRPAFFSLSFNEIAR